MLLIQTEHQLQFIVVKRPELWEPVLDLSHHVCIVGRALGPSGHLSVRETLVDEATAFGVARGLQALHDSHKSSLFITVELVCLLAGKVRR